MAALYGVSIEGVLFPKPAELAPATTEQPAEAGA